VTVLKHADDKQPQIDTLEALKRRPDVDRRTIALIDDEIWAIRLGRRGEDEAAYAIDFAYKGRENHVVIHDLRLEVGDRVAQIDHLILNRVLDLWVCETKAFSEGVKIDDRGYWRRYAGGKTYGMPSPVRQNENHVQVLRELFDSGAIDLPRRLVTLKPTCRPVVLLSNSAKLDLPRSAAKRAAIHGLDTVIKVEELKQTIYESLDDDMRALRALPKFVSASTIKRIGEQLLALHRPGTFDYEAKFGLRKREAPPISAAHVSAPERPSSCESCGRSLSAKVAAYAREHAEELGGRLLCYDCQQVHKRRARRDAQARQRAQA
jgi:hypothetical protein